MFCRTGSIRASTHNGEVIAELKCKSWRCEFCAPERQAQLQSMCINGTPNRFITITCRLGEFRRPECAAKAIAIAWRTAVQRWRRLKSWHKCQYIAVFEATEQGWPHLHILWRGHWLAQRWLSDQMTELLNSPIVDVRKIDNVRRRAFYVAKYFSEAPVRFGTCKRYWTSKTFGKPYSTDAEPAFPKPIAVAVTREPIADLLRQWYREAKQVWTIRNRLFGWGFLVDPQTGEIFERPTGSTDHEWSVAFDDD